MELLKTVIAKIAEMKVSRSAEPVLFLNMHVAQYKLESGSLPDAKVLVESGREELDRLSDVDPSVSAAVYYVASLYWKATFNYAEFYRTTLMYLSFVSSDTLPEASSNADPCSMDWVMLGHHQPFCFMQEFKVRMAVDVSLAALLGENVYSFGQLLQHPIAAALDNGPHQWLHEMLKVFNEGNLHR